jgi:hypothetical protein
MAPTHPPLLSAVQVHGFDPKSHGHHVPSMYDPNPFSGIGGRHDLSGHNHNASGNPPSLPSHRPFLQQLYTTGHLVGPSGPRAVLPRWTEDSIPTPGSHTAKTPTPEPEVEPPTQSLVRSLRLTYGKLLGSSALTYLKHLEGCYHDDSWELALDPDFDPFSMVEQW